LDFPKHVRRGLKCPKRRRSKTASNRFKPLEHPLSNIVLIKGRTRFGPCLARAANLASYMSYEPL
jgi:hypothetical protein